MKKKMMVMICAAFMAISSVACGGNTEAKDEETIVLTDNVGREVELP